MTPATYPLALALSILAAPTDESAYPYGLRPAGTACRESLADPGSLQCKPVGGIAIIDGEYSHHLAKVVYGPEDGDTFSIYHSTTLRHHAEPSVELSVDDADGRYVETCVAHNNPVVWVAGGMTPADWRFAVAHEKWVNESWAAMTAEPRRDYLAMLVERGLDSPSYQTRHAAHLVLVRAGMRAIGPCMVGMASRSVEVRTRCELILFEIKCGRMSMMGGE